MLDIQADDYKSAHRALKAADRKVANGVRRGLRKIAKPLGDQVLTEGSEGLPQSGGLASHVAAGGKVGLMMAATSARLKLSHAGVDVASLERGTVRYPLFGNKNSWHSHPVTAHLFTSVFEREGPAVAEAMRDELVTLTNELAREI